MIDWKRKLCSRKFWAAFCGFITGLLAYIQSPGDPTGLIMSGASLIAFIIGEGLIDAAAQSGDVYITEPEEIKPSEVVESDGD